MTIALVKKPVPAGTYAALSSAHAGDEIDAAAIPRIPQMDFSINQSGFQWNISVLDRGMREPFEARVYKNGKRDTSWDRGDQWDFVTMMNDQMNQAELRGQHRGYAQHFDAIRIFAQRMVDELRPNEPINCYIPREREFDRPVCNDPPEIVARRRWVEQQRNAYKRVFVGRDGYR